MYEKKISWTEMDRDHIIIYWSGYRKYRFSIYKTNCMHWNSLCKGACYEFIPNLEIFPRDIVFDIDFGCFQVDGALVVLVDDSLQRRYDTSSHKCFLMSGVLDCGSLRNIRFVCPYNLDKVSVWRNCN